MPDLPATLSIDADALAKLAPPTADSELLAKVHDLLVQVRDRLTAEAPLLVDEREAGRLLSCSARTVFGMAERGELHPVWPAPGAKRYAVSELKQWIEIAKNKAVGNRRQALPNDLLDRTHAA